jgi:hypothetical protein
MLGAPRFERLGAVDEEREVSPVQSGLLFCLTAPNHCSHTSAGVSLDLAKSAAKDEYQVRTRLL